MTDETEIKKSAPVPKKKEDKYPEDAVARPVRARRKLMVTKEVAENWLSQAGSRGRSQYELIAFGFVPEEDTQLHERLGKLVQIAVKALLPGGWLLLHADLGIVPLGLVKFKKEGDYFSFYLPK